MNSLRMSFWIVPERAARDTPCSSPATMKFARIGMTAPFIVMLTDTLSSGMPSKRIFMSSTESMATLRLTHVPHHAGVIAVVAAMRRQVEGHRHALLPPRQRATVERRSTPPPWKTPHTGGSSRGGPRTSSPSRRVCREPPPAASQCARPRSGHPPHRPARRRSPRASSTSGPRTAAAQLAFGRRGPALLVIGVGHVWVSCRATVCPPGARGTGHAPVRGNPFRSSRIPAGATWSRVRHSRQIGCPAFGRPSPTASPRLYESKQHGRPTCARS